MKKKEKKKKKSANALSSEVLKCAKELLKNKYMMY